MHKPPRQTAVCWIYQRQVQRTTEAFDTDKGTHRRRAIRQSRRRLASSLYELDGVHRLRRHRSLTRGEGVQVLEIQTDPRRWVQSDAGFPLRIRLDRPNLLLWLLVSGSRLYTGLVCVPLLLLPGRRNLLLPRSRLVPTYLLPAATLFGISLFSPLYLSLSF